MGYIKNSKDEIAKEELEYLSAVSKKPFARFFAIVGLLVIIGLIITTFILGIMGSEYFIGFLFLSIMAPVFIYVFLWMGKLLRSISKNDNKNYNTNDNNDFINK